MENITTVLDKKLKVTELVVGGTTLDEIKSNIRIQVEAKLDNIMQAMEVVAAKGNPKDIVAYNNALQIKEYIKLEIANKFIEQAEAIWKFKETLDKG